MDPLSGAAGTPAPLAILFGLGLGLSLALPPGPMNALMARVASQHGAAAGVRVGIAAPVADTVYLVVLSVGVGQFLQAPSVLRAAAGVGALLMVYFAWGTARSATAETHLFDDAGKRRPTRFLGAFGMAMSNPFQITWWMSAGFVFLQQQGWWGIAGFLSGIFAHVVVFSWLIAKGSRRWESFAPFVTIVSADLLLAFALLLGVSAVFPDPA